MREKRVARGICFPQKVVERAEEEATRRGITFSAFVCSLVENALGLESSPALRGGDHASSKSAETHARVCEKMREQKALKRVREEAARRIKEQRERNNSMRQTA